VHNEFFIQIRRQNLKQILFLASLLIFSVATHAESDLTLKAGTLKIDMTIEQVIELLGPATWAVKKGDKGEFALDPSFGLELTLRWDNAPYLPVAVDFNQAQKVTGWDLGKTKDKAMAGLMARGLADFSCQKEDRKSLCGRDSGDGLFSLTVKTVPYDSTVKIMNIGPKYEPGIGLKPGKYDILVQRSGYKKWHKWINLDSDTTLNVELQKKSEKPKKVSKKQSSYSCNKKYCKNMSSCAEARYQLNVCGYKNLDKDRDGIPCENVCK
jgi:hypothetical protein